MTHADSAAEAATPEFTLTRFFDAPRDLVFRVWTDPKYVALWWGMEGGTNPVCELDVRQGGRWRIHMRTPDGTVYPNGGVYLEVVENERIVSTDISDPDSPAWRGSPPGDRVNVATFADEGSGTRVTLRVEFKSVKDRDFFLRAGVKDGIARSLDRLARVLGDLRASRT